MDESRKAMWLIIDRLKMTPIQSPQQVPEFRCKELPLGDRVFQMQGLNSRDGNTVVTNYYQFEAGSIRDHAMLELLLTIMDEPVFDTLRTKEQLGYTVFSTLRNSFGVLGFTVTVCAQVTRGSLREVSRTNLVRAFPFFSRLASMMPTSLTSA